MTGHDTITQLRYAPKCCSRQGAVTSDPLDAQMLGLPYCVFSLTTQPNNFLYKGTNVGAHPLVANTISPATTFGVEKDG